MRLFLLLILFLNTALAGFPPTTLKGQGQSSSTTTFNFQVPAKQATKTSTGTLIETGNKNKLSNPGFEHSTFSTDVTTSGSSISLAEETTIIHSGLKSAKATFTASTNGLVKLVSSAGSYDVQQFQGKVWIYNEDGVATASVCSLSGTTVGNCQSIISTTGWNEYAVPFVGSATGENGIVIGTTGAAITGDFYIDDAEVFTGGTNYVTATNQDYDWTAYTPTFTGFGSVTNIDCKHKRNGSDLLIDCRFTTGTPTATEARVSLPSGLTSSSSLPTLSIAGSMIDDLASADVRFVLKEPSVTYVTFGYQNGASGALTKRNGNTAWGTAYNESFIARVPIQGWNTPNQVIATVKDNVQMSVPNGKPKECAWRQGSTGTVTDDWSDCISGNCTKNSTGNYTCTFTSGYFSVAPICVLQPRTGGNGNRSDGITETATTVTWQNIEGTATAVDSTYSGSCKGY